MALSVRLGVGQVLPQANGALVEDGGHGRDALRWDLLNVGDEVEKTRYVGTELRRLQESLEAREKEEDDEESILVDKGEKDCSRRVP